MSGWGRERARGNSGASQPEGLLRMQPWERQGRGGHRDGAELAGVRRVHRAPGCRAEVPAGGWEGPMLRSHALLPAALRRRNPAPALPHKLPTRRQDAPGLGRAGWPHGPPPLGALARSVAARRPPALTSKQIFSPSLSQSSHSTMQSQPLPSTCTQTRVCTAGQPHHCPRRACARAPPGPLRSPGARAGVTGGSASQQRM